MGKRNVGGIVGNLGTRLRKWRKIKKMKGIQLAKKIGISQASLSVIENNYSLPSVDTLTKLHECTDFNIIWLLVNEKPMEIHRSDPNRNCPGSIGAL